MTPSISRAQVLGYRFRVQQLDRSGQDLLDVAALELGVQDTGPDGAGWALVNRGVDPKQLASLEDDLVLAWTLRGAPHFYRRGDIAGVAAATAPFSEQDAAKRIFDAAKPLRAAGISALEALDEVASQMRDIVATPTVKGTMSTALTDRLSAPYLRDCRACNAIHSYEQPFRLAALRAGLELRPGTSPPVLEPIPGWTGRADSAPDRLDVVRAYLHLLGPATPKTVAAYLDAPVKDVRTRWPEDVAEVDVTGERCWILADDLPDLESAEMDQETVRLLSPFDLFLQARDRELLVPDPACRKELWVVLGRPGAVVVGGEVVGTWRPRSSGKSLTLRVHAWAPVSEELLTEQAERLADYRGVRFAGFTDR